jgi:hypothetical protein
MGEDAKLFIGDKPVGFAKEGMLTYKNERSEAPAGLGSTVYFCSADDLKMADGRPLSDVLFHKIDLTDNGGGLTRESKSGFQATATVTLKDSKASELVKRLLNPRVRLPRKEKKRRLNNVMRHLQMKATIIMLNLFSPRTGQMLALSLLFPDKLPMRVEVFGQQAVTISETQAWLLRLLTERLSKNIRRILFREGGLKLVGRTTSDGDASAEIVVTREQADRIRQMFALEDLDRQEEKLLNDKRED